MKVKSVGMPDEIFERLKIEREKTGIPATTTIIMALKDYFNKLDQERNESPVCGNLKACKASGLQCPADTLKCPHYL